ncbi:MAG: hypothetical protein ISS79_02400 [Phycisphaerae bacterium]|nr:hypothetical protein [Phycisphaerae bacterium]
MTRHLWAGRILFAASVIITHLAAAQGSINNTITPRGGLLNSIGKYILNPDKAARPQPVPRIVHFPPDKDLGLLKTIEASKTHPSIVNTHFNYRGLGPARGDVIVPAGKRLILYVSERTLKNLPGLAGLKPDDLYKVSLRGSYSGGPKLGDIHLRHLAHLTGLRQLCLYNSNITQRGIQHILALKQLNYIEISSERLDNRALPYIAQLSSLETLVLGAPVTDEGLRSLAPLKNLKELFLRVKNIRGPGLRHLAELPNLQYLQVKYTDDRGKYVFGDSSLRYIKDIPTLRHLKVWWQLPITERGIAYLAQCTQLEEIELSKLPVTDRNLSQLKALPRLKGLDVSGGESKVTDAGVMHVGQMKQLESVSLPHTITDTGAAHLAGLTRLKSLKLGGPITDAGISRLAGLKDLEELELWCDRITDTGIAHIATLTKLRTLKLARCRMSNAGLAQLARLKSLEKLSIRGTNITLSGLNRLNPLKKLRELTVKFIARDEELLDISGLTALERLSLSLSLDHKYEHRDEDLACLSKLTRLQHLGIGPRKGITDAGLGHLAGLTGIERLHLGGKGVTDAGLAHLTGMKRLTNMSISGDFSDKGLRHLESLQALCVLDFWRGANFTTRAMNEFKRKMPYLAVFRNMGPSPKPRTSELPASNRSQSRTSSRRRR